MKEFDGVDCKYGINGTWGCLKVGEHVLPEEFDDVNEDVSGGDTELYLTHQQLMTRGTLDLTC